MDLSTFGWVGGSGWGQNPQKKQAFKILSRGGVGSDQALSQAAPYANFCYHNPTPLHYELLLGSSHTFDIFSLFFNFSASQTTIEY